MEYEEFGSEKIDEIYAIYEANEWESYLNDKERLKKAFEKSLYVLGAFDEGKLVGFVRCIGDEEYIVYVQDLIVLPEHRRQGIGRRLMEEVLKRYEKVRQFVLITDEDDEVSNAFYKAIGLSDTCNGYPVNHYFRGN